MPGRILPLDIETQSRLRSTQILTSVPQIVSELVQNSLDANATHIEIGINADEWECYVKDDGIGMSKADMRALAQGSTQGRYSEWQTAILCASFTRLVRFIEGIPNQYFRLYIYVRLPW